MVEAKAVRVAVLALVTSVALPAQAARARRPKAIVLDFPQVKAFDEATNKVLNDFFATDLRQQGFQVITSADIVAALGVEKQKQLLGCGDAACLAELGGAMGSDFIAHGSVAVLEEETALSLSLEDSRGSEINRVSARVGSKTASALLSQLERLVPQLVQPLRDQGKIASAGPPQLSPSIASTAPAGSPTAAAPVVRTRDEDKRDAASTMRWVGYLVGGAGLLVGLSALIPYSASNAQYTNAANGSLATGAAITHAVAAGNTDRYLADALLATGVVGLGVGAALIFTNLDPGPYTAAVSMNPMARSVVATLTFP